MLFEEDAILIGKANDRGGDEDDAARALDVVEEGARCDEMVLRRSLAREVFEPKIIYSFGRWIRVGRARRCHASRRQTFCVSWSVHWEEHLPCVRTSARVGTRASCAHSASASTRTALDPIERCVDDKGAAAGTPKIEAVVTWIDCYRKFIYCRANFDRRLASLY